MLTSQQLFLNVVNGSEGCEGCEIFGFRISTSPNDYWVRLLNVHEVRYGGGDYASVS